MAIDTEELLFTPLGSGNEVGRSSHLLEFKGKKILLDCGLHPGKQGGNALPFFDVIEPAEIDLVLITHFHVDHVAALPYFTERTEFNGEIFMTRPTRVVAELLLKDYVRIIHNNADNEEDVLFNSDDVQKCLQKCQVIDFHQVVTARGIKFSPLFAGHVLGAAMFLIEISNVRILYTGDFSRELDRHLIPAEVPSSIEYQKSSKALDLLIMESTFGTMVHQDRNMRENIFTSSITNVLNRGGVCLVPVFSLGRAQELLLILEDFWKNHPELHSYKVYHYSKSASIALEVFKTYTNVMNDSIREARKISNPWEFNYIFPFDQSNKGLESVVQEPCVIMASPGMLQNGVSRRIFEKICSDEKNGLLLCGYSVEGTLAFQLAKDSSIKNFQSAFSNAKLSIRCSIEQVTFAAHSDILGTREFVNKIKPKNLILVHGDSMQMKRLRKDLGNFFTEQNKRQIFELNQKLNQVKRQQQQENEMKRDETLEKKLKEEEGVLTTQLKVRQQERIRIFMPHNTQKMILKFEDKRIVKLLGNLSLNKKAFKVSESKEHNLLQLNGYLVRKNFEEVLVDRDEVETYTELTRNVINHQLYVPFHGTMFALVELCQQLFAVEKFLSKTTPAQELLLVEKRVTISFKDGKGSVLLSWEVSVMSDIIADTIVTLLLQFEGGVHTVKKSKCQCKGHLGNDKISSQSMEVELSLENLISRNIAFSFLYRSLCSWFGEDNVMFAIGKDSTAILNVTQPEYQSEDVKDKGEGVYRGLGLAESTSDIICKLLFDKEGCLLNVVHEEENSSTFIKQKVLDLIENTMGIASQDLAS